MVSTEQKKRMREFVTGCLEDSGLYNIVKSDISHILVAERPELTEQPRTIDVLTHNYHRTVRELMSTLRHNHSEGISTAHIFYKDGETFMVRLGRRGKIKDIRSLKQYTKQQIDAMIHLRDIEGVVLERSGGELIYYQPETARLEEGIRIFEMRRVALDYTHIRPGDSGYGFARDTVSKDYKQAVEIGATTGPIELLVGASGYASIVPMEYVKPVKAEQLRLL
jgi:hypothetical protein